MSHPDPTKEYDEELEAKIEEGDRNHDRRKEDEMTTPDWEKAFREKFYYTTGSLEDQIDFIKSHIEAAEKRATQNKKVEIQEKLLEYSMWLEKHGYMDADWWRETPTAVNRFLASLNQP